MALSIFSTSARRREYLYYTMELADDCDRRPRDRSDKLRTAHTEERSRPATRFSAAEAIQLGLSLTSALEALHARGLAHRDIKPANIIFIDGVPKLADIGLVAASRTTIVCRH